MLRATATTGRLQAPLLLQRAPARPCCVCVPLVIYLCTFAHPFLQTHTYTPTNYTLQTCTYNKLAFGGQHFKCWFVQETVDCCWAVNKECRQIAAGQCCFREPNFLMQSHCVMWQRQRETQHTNTHTHANAHWATLSLRVPMYIF